MASKKQSRRTAPVSRDTSPQVAAKAARLMQHADADVRSVAASAVAQAGEETPVLVAPEPVPVPPALATAAPALVAALEARGLVAAADTLREIAELPPRQRTRDEDFLATVVEQVDGGLAVGFVCRDEDEAHARMLLIAALPTPPGRAYRVTRQGARLECRLMQETG